ncbi:MAG: TIM barrel protein [Firmicutes bacterium]|nr:TIM barrel protein [Bacillota bacterium]
MIRFGPSGNSQSFYDQGYNSSIQMPAWLRGMSLDAYEYQCSKGVNIGEATAKQIGRKASEYDIFMSIHAPYYINIASEDPNKREKSIWYILETLKAASWMCAQRVVVHMGSCSNVDRRWAMDTAITGMKETILRADDMGYGNISICPEVLGKINQLGSLDEILEICTIDERLIPTLDFGHLHARNGGNLKTAEDFRRVLDRVEEVLGYERMQKLHIHFSRIEFTRGGEKKHWTLADTQYGPEFHPLVEVICEKRMEPVVICESRENMAEDALELKRIYNEICKR